MKNISQKVCLAFFGAVVAVLVSVQPTSAQVDELTGQIINEEFSSGFVNENGEYHNTVILYHRSAERTFVTADGTYTVPASVPVNDARRVEDWYVKGSAKVSFVFVEKIMVRVDVSY